MKLEQKIDQYLSGQMTVTESVQFENELAQDEAMQREVELQQVAMQAIRMKGEGYVKSILQKHESDRYSIFERGSLLAILAVLIGSLALLYFYKKPQVDTKQQIFAQYFEPYKSPTVLRGTDQAASAWSRGSHAYANGDYRLAAQEFSSIESEANAPYYLVKFYLANSLLASDTNETKTAIELLSELIEEQHDYVEQSKWYLALAYLKSNMRTEGVQLLTELIRQKQYKDDEAKHLLDLLRERN